MGTEAHTIFLQGRFATADNNSTQLVVRDVSGGMQPGDGGPYNERPDLMIGFAIVAVVGVCAQVLCMTAGEHGVQNIGTCTGPFPLTLSTSCLSVGITELPLK